MEHRPSGLWPAELHSAKAGTAGFKPAGRTGFKPMFQSAREAKEGTISCSVRCPQRIPCPRTRSGRGHPLRQRALQPRDFPSYNFRNVRPMLPSN